MRYDPAVRGAVIPATFRCSLNEGLKLCPRFIDIHDGVTDMGIREIDMGHSPIPSRRFDSSANIDSVLRNSSKDRECLFDLEPKLAG